MCTVVSVIEGIKEFFEEELVTKASGLGKWFIGAGISLAMDNAVNTFNELKSNAIIKTMGIIHEDDTIDIVLDKSHCQCLDTLGIIFRTSEQNGISVFLTCMQRRAQGNGYGVCQ